MCASVIGKPDPQTEKLLEAIFGPTGNREAAVGKEARERGLEDDPPGSAKR